jgi:hypothetical protein
MISLNLSGKFFYENAFFASMVNKKNKKTFVMLSAVFQTTMKLSE